MTVINQANLRPIFCTRDKLMTTIVGRHRAKIGAMQAPSDETVAYAKGLNAHLLGPGSLAEGEWAALGLPAPHLGTIRRYRLERIRQLLRRFDYAGIVVYDPINIRYATDSTNMQVWILHNANRYAYIPTEGPVILFDYHGAEHLSDHLELISEIRTARAWYYLIAGDRYEEQARLWAAEIGDLVRQHGGGNRRLALDKCNPEGLLALQNEGLTVHNGEEIMELARAIKHPEEIVAMRRAIAACEKAIAAMRDHFVPGVTEQRLWSYLHAENIARGGEWIETRLLTAGPRTNPWFQECSSRPIQNGELMAFDTDLIGPYGICVDISRTWLCGDAAPTAEQREIYGLAYDQIVRNTTILRPGMSFRELTETAVLPDPTRYNRYSLFYHGVGLADEYPSIYFPDAWANYGYNGIVEPGMVLCVESYVGRKNGREGVKLEEQVLITETGYEVLSTYPFEEPLLG